MTVPLSPIEKTFPQRLVDKQCKPFPKTQTSAYTRKYLAAYLLPTPPPHPHTRYTLVPVLFFPPFIESRYPSTWSVRTPLIRNPIQCDVGGDRVGLKSDCDHDLERAQEAMHVETRVV